MLNDKYKKLKCVQGLIMSLDEQIIRFDNLQKTERDFNELVDSYYKMIENELMEGQ